MAKIRFDANVPVEVALKFSEGKRVPSALKDKDGNPLPDQMFYTLCGDDTMYVSLAVAEKITALGIKKLELFSITKSVRNQVTKWEVQRVGDTATAALPASTSPRHGDDCDCSECESHWTKANGAPMAPMQTMLENQLTRSIEQAKARRVSEAPAASQNTTSSSADGTHHNTIKSTPPVAHTVISRIMASALIAAFDASQECERYAHTKGIELEFGTEDIRAISNTIFIQLSKDPRFLAPAPEAGKVNGGTQWQQH